MFDFSLRCGDTESKVSLVASWLSLLALIILYKQNAAAERKRSSFFFFASHLAPGASFLETLT